MIARGIIIAVPRLWWLWTVHVVIIIVLQLARIITTVTIKKQTLMKNQITLLGLAVGLILSGCATDGTVYVDDGPHYARANVYYDEPYYHRPPPRYYYDRGPTVVYRESRPAYRSSYRSSGTRVVARSDASRSVDRSSATRNVKKSSGDNESKQKHHDDSGKKHKK
jgi:hypothetical protein